VREEGDAVAKTTRVLAVGVMVAAILAADRVDASDEQQPPNLDVPAAPTVPHVRTEDPVLAALIREATDRSPTFRRLVEAIQATDGVVYVERGRCGHYTRTCLAFWMAVAGPNRILRVIVDERKTGMEAMVSIAHELQHALEVLGDRSVTTAAAMHGFFERIGVWRTDSFETYAAVRVDEAVRSELRKRRPGPVK
jgi:hypothetical protein